MQTIGGRVLRSGRGVTLRRRRVDTPDGDFIDLDWTVAVDGRAVPDDVPLVLCLHGLEGSARSNYMMQLYRALAGRGLQAVGLNFRSCSGEPNRLPRLYHSGETGDLGFIVELIQREYPARPLGAVGFSLGGNVLLKFLGERGDDVSLGFAAAAISVPYQLELCAARMNRGFSRVYRWYLLRKLKRKVVLKRRIVAPLIDTRRALNARTFEEFDDAATAPLHGFEGAVDYYARSSSRNFLKSIRRPTLLIQAHDDPFVPEGMFSAGLADGNPALTPLFVPAGGHVGFVSGSFMRPVFWAEETAADFMNANLRCT